MDAPVDVLDHEGLVARVHPVPGERGTTLVVEPARVPFTEDEVRLVLDRVDAERAATGARRLRARDGVLRDRARARGYDGALRADLEHTGAPAVEELDRYLPDTQVVIARESVWRRGARRLASGVGDLRRVVATRDRVTVEVIAPIGETTMTESLAATIDTLLRVSLRLGPLADRIPPITFSVPDQRTAVGHVAGSNAGAAIALSPWYVDRAAVARVRARLDDSGRDAYRTPQRVDSVSLAVDAVVAHEVGHSLDQAVGSGALSDSVEWRRAIGAALGLPSVEPAVRPRTPADEPARRALAEQLSDYATTNCQELFAEAFEAWYFGVRNPVVDAFAATLHARYPDLPR
jgi:hypothetical protein